MAIESLVFTCEDGGRHRLSVSIGVACKSDAEKAMSPERLLHAADQALYEAKRQGQTGSRRGLLGVSPGRPELESRVLLDLGFLEGDVLADDRIVFLRFELAGLGAGVLLGHIEVAGVRSRHEPDLNGIRFRHTLSIPVSASTRLPRRARRGRNMLDPLPQVKICLPQLIREVPSG